MGYNIELRSPPSSSLSQSPVGNQITTKSTLCTEEDTSEEVNNADASILGNSFVLFLRTWGCLQ